LMSRTELSTPGVYRCHHPSFMRGRCTQGGYQNPYIPGWYGRSIYQEGYLASLQEGPNYGHSETGRALRGARMARGWPSFGVKCGKCAVCGRPGCWPTVKRVKGGLSGALLAGIPTYKPQGGRHIHPGRYNTRVYTPREV